MIPGKRKINSRVYPSSAIGKDNKIRGLIPVVNFGGKSGRDSHRKSFRFEDFRKLKERVEKEFPKEGYEITIEKVITEKGLDDGKIIKIRRNGVEIGSSEYNTVLSTIYKE
ncbi:MAG TPA: hypothetical protein VFF13_06265 [archaeon]|nr:hypothetical protein [archaeon]